jgi:hypothetical protein
MLKRILLITICTGLTVGLVSAIAVKHQKIVLSTRSINKKNLPRIAICGLGIESSTFSPALTDEAAFHAKYGAGVFSSYPFMAADSPLRKSAVWFPALVGKSLPGGAVTRAAYESLVGKMLDSLKKHLPYDGLYFDIHGAMSVVGLDDPEGDMITRIRKVVGTKPLSPPPWTCMAMFPGDWPKIPT